MRLASVLAPLILASAMNGASVDPASLDSFKTVPPSARIWFQHLARYQINQDEIAKMRQVPGVAPALIELATRLITENQDSEHLYFVFEALRLRNDLSESHQESLRSLLLPLIGQDRGSMGDVIKERGLSTLAEYPTPQNEDVLIKFLADRKGDDNPFGYSFISAKSLAKIGTAKALKPLREYAERIKPPPGQSLDHYDTAIGAEKQILARLSAGTNSTPPKSSAVNSTASKLAKSSSDQGSTPSEEPTSSTPWSIIVVLIVAATGLLWLLVKKRK
jgi:hypothetical protein